MIGEYELNKIYCEDSYEAIKKIPDNYFDLAIVDPPYGIGVDGGIGGGVLAKKSSFEKKGWDTKSPDEDYFKELMRVSKNQIIWGANHFISKIPFDFSCFLIWDKGQRNFSLADGEMAWTSFKTSARFFNYSRAKALQEGKIHPTQKPVALYAWLLNNQRTATIS